MNDRLKYRVWFNRSKRYAVNKDDIVLFPDGVVGQFDIVGCYDEKDVTVEQCTGLRDKNGKLIYEGDVLEVSVFDKNNCHSKKKTRWSVEHKIFNNNIGFMVYGINRRWHALMTSNMLYNAEAVVIGNIHEV